MANRFIDSCDHYATADIGTKYNGAAGDVTIVSGGRTNNALQVKSDGATAAYAPVVLDEQSTWYVGFAVKLTAAPNKGALVAFATGSAQNMQCGVMLTSSSQIVFCDDSRNQIGTVDGGVLSLNVWYYVEVKMMFKSSITSGDCVIRINEVVVATLDAGTRTNWFNSSITTARAIWIGTPFFFLGSTSLTALYDDIYINDSTGSVNNSYLGDITVDALFTSAVGTYQDFAVVGTSTSVLATTDRAEDGDTTYVQSSSTGARESFLFTQPSFSIVNVYAMQMMNFSKKSSSGSRSLVPFTRSGITNYEQTAVALGTTYTYSRTTVEVDPSTGVAWTESAIQNIEAGVKAT